MLINMAMAVVKTRVSCIIVHIMALWVGLLFCGGAEAQCKLPCPSQPGCDAYSDAEAGFCASSTYVHKAQQRVRYEQYSYSQRYTTSCWVERCTEYRTRYSTRSIYYNTYFSEQVCSRYCCAGYAGTAPNNCEPECPTACLNGGTCTAPDTCTCAPGYRGVICQEDINECTETNGPCLQICTNEIGSYECSCYDGYLIGLSGDCEDIDECTNQDYPHDCSAGCVNTIGSFNCTCNTGYRLNPVTNKDCYAVCDPPCVHGTCERPSMCTCQSGYTGSTCADDINECTETNGPCLQICTNEIGSYECSCYDGYLIGLSGNCEDIDECTNQDYPHDCSAGCVNTIGSFNCTCNTGYRLNPVTNKDCYDIDECDGFPCEHNCTNIPGSFSCSCATGFQLVGETRCQDIDECSSASPPCHQLCTNSPGSFTCSCKSGFLETESGTCEDIDECLTDSDNCSHTCSNQAGGYQCSCPYGFVVRNDRHTCEEFNVLSPPSVEAEDQGFIDILRNHLFAGCSGDVCSCAATLFASLENSGYGVKSGTHIIDMDRGSPKPIGDLIYAALGPDSKLALPVQADIERMNFDCSSREFTAITLTVDKDWKVFPSIVEFSKVYMTLRFRIEAPSSALSELIVSGIVTIGGVSTLTDVDITGSDTWYINYHLDQFSVENVFEFVSQSFETSTTSAPFRAPVPLNEASLVGSIDVAGYELTLVFSGQTMVSNDIGTDIYVIVNQALNNVGITEPSITVFTGCMSSTTLGLNDFLQSINSSWNITTYAVMGSLVMSNFHLSYASSRTCIPGSTLQPLGVPANCLLCDGDSDSKMMFVFTDNEIEVNWSLVLDKDESDSFTGDITMKPFRDIFTVSSAFEFLSEGSLSPGAVQVLKQPDVSGNPIDKLVLDIASGDCIINSPNTERIKMSDFFNIRDVNIAFTMLLAGPGGVVSYDGRYDLTGGVNVVGLEFSITIEDRDGSEFAAIGCAKLQSYSLGFQGLLSALSEYANDGAVSDVIDSLGLFDFGFINPCVELVVPNPGEFPTTTCFSADFLRTKWVKVVGSLCIDNQNVYYIGFQIDPLDLIGLFDGFIDREATSQSPFLTQTGSAALAFVSSAGKSIPSLPLSGVGFAALYEHYGGVLEGTTIYVSMTWPSSCQSNSFCKILYDALGPDVRFFLFVYITKDFSKVNIEAGLKDFRIGELQLSIASLILEFVTKPVFSVSIGVQAGIVIDLDEPDEDLQLIGGLSVRFPKLTITASFALKGCWNKTFGIPILKVCDFLLEVQITPGVPLPTGFAFGMRIEMGFPECSKIEATGYIRIDTTSPAKNFLYVLIKTPVTLQYMLDVLCTGVQLPAFLGNSGLPEGYEFSYAKEDTLIKQLGIFIPGGVVFNGVFNFFGLEIKIKLYTDFEDVFELEGRMSPLNLAGGLVKLFESKTKHDDGPFLYILLRAAPVKAFVAEASGYVSLFGIEAEAKISFNLGGFDLRVSGKIFNVLEAHLRIYANTNQVYNSEIGIEANITSSILESIEEGVVGLLQAAGDGAEAALSGAQDGVREAQKELDKVNAALRQAEADAEGAIQDVRNARRKVGSIRNGLCQYRRCRDVCVPFLCGCGCAVRVWGACVIPCLTWKSCCFTIPDPLCILANVGCTALRVLAEVAIAFAQGVLYLAEGAVRLYQGILKAAQVLVSVAKLALEVLIGILEAIKLTFKYAIKALQAIASFLLTGIINIKGMGFDAKIGLMSHGHITAWADISFFRSEPVHLEITIPIFNPLALASDLADQAIPGIGRKKRSARSVDKVYWLANHFKTKRSIYPLLQ